MLDPTTVGMPGPTTHVAWTTREAMLYALSVGAGSDPARELAYTTDNTDGVPLRALPGFALILGQRSERPWFGEVDGTRLVHGEQSVTWAREVPPEGEATVSTSVVDMADKGSAALVTTETIAATTDGSALFTSRSTLFLRGYGGFGRPSGLPARAWERPEREPDHVARAATLPQQALLYRLNVDRNPLHSDPGFAARAGFSRPILHGLCTYGFGLRLLTGAYCDGDGSAARQVSGRFSAPVYPGQELVVISWRAGTGRVLFQIVDPAGTVVVDRGEFTYA